MRFIYKALISILLFACIIETSLVVVPRATTSGIAPEEQMMLAEGEGWLAGWDFRKRFSFGIDADIGAVPLPIDVYVQYGSGSDAANIVYLSSHSQSDFDDIRFTTENGVTVVDYWRQEYTVSDNAIFWVNYTLPAATPDYGYIYYGNTGVSTTSNGDATFTFFDDFSGASLNTTKWDWFWSVGGGTLEVTGGELHMLTPNVGNQGDAIKMNTTTYSPFNTDFCFQWGADFEDSELYSQFGLCKPTTTNPTVTTDKIAMVTGRPVNYFLEGDGVDSESDIVTLSGETNYTIGKDGTGQNFFYEGPTPRDTDHDYDYVSDTTFQIAAVRHVSGAGAVELYTDWVFGRTWAGVVEPYFYSWQTEEGASSADWGVIDNVIIHFSVEFDMWGMDTALIILGLVMIPTSTIYLAYGVKHDRSSNRLFYGLIIFFLGCGLFIGGVMP